MFYIQIFIAVLRLLASTVEAGEQNISLISPLNETHGKTDVQR